MGTRDKECQILQNYIFYMKFSEFLLFSSSDELDLNRELECM